MNLEICGRTTTLTMTVVRFEGALAKILTVSATKLKFEVS